VEEKDIVTFRDRFMNFALKHSKFFEPFAPFGISYYLKGQLKQYRQHGKIDAYHTKVKRLGKWHYKIEITADITVHQLAEVLTDLHERLGF
jgi:hypothetical protein